MNKVTFKERGISLLESLITLALLSVGLVSYQISSNTLIQASASHQQQLNNYYRQQAKNALEIILSKQVDPTIIERSFNNNANSNGNSTLINCDIGQWCTALQLIEYESSIDI